jgi:hypothetical protein
MSYIRINIFVRRFMRIGIRRLFLKPIQRDFHPRWSLVENMSIDHRRLDIIMAQELLYRSNFVAGFEQMYR